MMPHPTIASAGRASILRDARSPVAIDTHNVAELGLTSRTGNEHDGVSLRPTGGANGVRDTVVVSSPVTAEMPLLELHQRRATRNGSASMAVQEQVNQGRVRTEVKAPQTGGLWDEVAHLVKATEATRRRRRTRRKWLTLTGAVLASLITLIVVTIICGKLKVPEHPSKRLGGWFKRMRNKKKSGDRAGLLSEEQQHQGYEATQSSSTPARTVPEETNSNTGSSCAPPSLGSLAKSPNPPKPEPEPGLEPDVAGGGTGDDENDSGDTVWQWLDGVLRATLTNTDARPEIPPADQLDKILDSITPNPETMTEENAACMKIFRQLENLLSVSHVELGGSRAKGTAVRGEKPADFDVVVHVAVDGIEGWNSSIYLNDYWNCMLQGLMILKDESGKNVLLGFDNDKLPEVMQSLDVKEQAKTTLAGVAVLRVGGMHVPCDMTTILSGVKPDELLLLSQNNGAYDRLSKAVEAENLRKLVQVSHIYI